MDISSKRIFEVLSLDKIFFEKYLEDYFKRLMNSFYDEQILNNFLEFLKRDNLDLYPADLLNLGDKVNFSKKLFGFRTHNYDNEQINIINIPDYDKVFNKIYTLLDCYRGIWSNLEELEREAYFHLHLMRIYPYLDNNEMICLLVLSANLINKYYCPFILNDEGYDLYYELINSGDALKFKDFILKKSNEELIRFINLYKEFYRFPPSAHIKEIIMQKNTD